MPPSLAGGGCGDCRPGDAERELHFRFLSIERNMIVVTVFLFDCEQIMNLCFLIMNLTEFGLVLDQNEDHIPELAGAGDAGRELHFRFLSNLKHLLPFSKYKFTLLQRKLG